MTPAVHFKVKVNAFFFFVLKDCWQCCCGSKLKFQCGSGSSIFGRIRGFDENFFLQIVIFFPLGLYEERESYVHQMPSAIKRELPAHPEIS